MTTDRYKALRNLSESQNAALDVLAVGGTQEAAATAAGVHRVTVTNWCNYHPAFIAERNRRKLEMQQATADKAMSLVFEALRLLETELSTGNVTVALAALKWAGVQNALRSQPPGATTADGVVESQARGRVKTPLDLLVEDMGGVGLAVEQVTRDIWEEAQKRFGDG